MTIHQSSHGQIDFEVTPEMEQTLRPLGTGGPENFAGAERVEAMRELKSLIVDIDQRLLPTGFWDCYPDEGHWDYDEQSGQEVETPCDCKGGVHRGDDVFVRIPMSHWDESLQVFVKGDDITINGEPYSPEDCVIDLLALLRVYQLFAKRGQV